MAPMKAMKSMKRKAAPGASGLASRCASVKKAIEKAEECPDRVKQMLCSTLAFTAGTPKADRHPFNDRFVAMIEAVLEAEHARLTQDVATKDATFTELSPAKATRESALEEKKGVSKEKGEGVDQAKQAVSDVAATVKEAAAKLDEAKKAQKSGDQEAQSIVAKKSGLAAVQENDLKPLVEGTNPDADAKSTQVAAVLGAGKDFAFDASLMNTAAQVLQRDASERGAFDATCLEQLQAAFAGALVKLDEEIAVHAPAMAERAAAVEAADAAKQAADASQADLKEKLAAAKEAKAAADAEQKAAAKSLSDFMPELKTAGDSLDEARRTVKAFDDGARTAFNELKEFKEGDFVVKSYYQQVDGMRLDRGVIDACREGVAVDGPTPGRVTVEDAQKVFAKIADGGKETRTERWTLRYCLLEFKWTDAAHDWIVEELKKVPQEDAPAKRARTDGKGYYETIDGYKCDRAIVDVCREAVAVEGSNGRVSAEGAQKVWEKAADGNKVTHAEKWTLRHCMSAFNWSREGHDFVLEKLRELDHKAADA